MPLRLEGPFVAREEEEEEAEAAAALVVGLAAAAAVAEESTMVACGLRGGAAFRGLGNPLAPPLALPPLPPAPLAPVAPLALAQLLALLPDFSFGRCTLSDRVLRELPCKLLFALLLLLLLLQLLSRLPLLRSDKASKFEAGASLTSSSSPVAVVAPSAAAFTGGVIEVALAPSPWSPSVLAAAAAAPAFTGGPSSVGIASFAESSGLALVLLVLTALAEEGVLAAAVSPGTTAAVSDAGTVTLLGALCPVNRPSGWNNSFEVDDADGFDVEAAADEEAKPSLDPPSGVLQNDACREKDLATLLSCVSSWRPAYVCEN